MKISDVTEALEKSSPTQEAVLNTPGYMESSSGIIQEALKNGFDVLQLENGDIVTTGTKVVVTTYRWSKDHEEMLQIDMDHQDL